MNQIIAFTLSVGLTSTLSQPVGAMGYQYSCGTYQPAPGTGVIIFNAVVGSMCYEAVPGQCDRTIPLRYSHSGSLEFASGTANFDEYFALGQSATGVEVYQWIRVYRDTLALPVAPIESVHGADIMGDLFPGSPRYHIPRAGGLPEVGDPMCIRRPIL